MTLSIRGFWETADDGKTGGPPFLLTAKFSSVS